MVNRHERRRAAAPARRASGPRGDMHRINAALAALGGMRGQAVHGVIEHDPTCAIYRGGPCNCVPNVSLHPDGGGDVIVVDQDGRGKKSVKS